MLRTSTPLGGRSAPKALHQQIVEVPSSYYKDWTDLSLGQEPQQAFRGHLQVLQGCPSTTRLRWLGAQGGHQILQYYKHEGQISVGRHQKTQHPPGSGQG